MKHFIYLPLFLVLSMIAFACKDKAKEAPKIPIIKPCKPVKHRSENLPIFFINKPVNMALTDENPTYHVRFFSYNQALAIFESPGSYCVNPEGLGFYIIKKNSINTVSTASPNGKCGWYALDVDLFGIACNIEPEDTATYTINFNEDICNDFDSCSDCGY